MKLPRPASSFDSQDEFNDYWEHREAEEEAERQASDDEASGE